MMDEKRILLVDDEESIRESYSQAFSKAGYKVLKADSGEQALETIRTTPPSVAFLDLNLPGMNGVELCRKIRKDWPMVIPYAMTGYVSLFELTDCRSVGFEDYFAKPVGLSDLLEAAEHAFRKIERWKRR